MKALEREEIEVLEELENKRDDAPKKKIAKAIPQNWIVGLIIVAGLTIYGYVKQVITLQISLVIGGVVVVIIFLFMQQQEVENKSLITIEQAYAILKKDILRRKKIGELHRETGYKPLNLFNLHKIQGKPIKFAIGYELEHHDTGLTDEYIMELEPYTGHKIANLHYPEGVTGREESDIVLVRPPQERWKEKYKVG